MTDWTAPARNIRPGDLYRSMGPGWRARTVLAVASMCTCQNPYGGGITAPGRLPPPCPPGHRAVRPNGGVPDEHHAIIVVTTVDMVSGLRPHQPVTMTDSAW